MMGKKGKNREKATKLWWKMNKEEKLLDKKKT